MIDFQPMTLADREAYMQALLAGPNRGCEYSFANLYLWGRQKLARIGDSFAVFSQFNRRSVYPWPVCTGDVRPVLEAIMRDAKKRGIPCRITSLMEQDMALLEQLYPGKFRFHCDRDFYDYVYDINDLADLKGRKFQKKRNHFNRFLAAHPNHTVQPITPELLPQAKAFADGWYARRLQEDPQGDYHMERIALTRALEQHAQLDMETLLLMEEGQILALTMASPLSADTFDVHFEKASADVDGAYPAINCLFARYLRDKYPQLRYLNREDDMGLEGLRKAKLSYCPHHMVEKCWACLLEDGYDY